MKTLGAPIQREIIEQPKIKRVDENGKPVPKPAPKKSGQNRQRDSREGSRSESRRDSRNSSRSDSRNSSRNSSRNENNRSFNKPSNKKVVQSKVSKDVAVNSYNCKRVAKYCGSFCLYITRMMARKQNFIHRIWNL